MSQEEMLARELQRFKRIDRDAELNLDDETRGENTEMDLELLAARVRSARLAGV